MTDFFSLQDRVAVISGDTSGIGLEAAKQFIGPGAKVEISGRIPEPEEVAALVHYLASTNCNYKSGQTIAVNG